jgi:hypothetical protein
MPARRVAGRTTTMPEPALILDQDQADDLRELIDLTVIVQQWPDQAADHILNDLAGFAYPHTFHPRSYALWLTEDLASISTRLQQATNSSCGPLDTPAPIGNQIPPSRRERAGQRPLRQPGEVASRLFDRTVTATLGGMKQPLLVLNVTDFTFLRCVGL